MQQLENISVCEHVVIKSEDVVSGWWTNSRELITRKIIRNWVLGEYAYSGNKFETRYFGNMLLMRDNFSSTIMNMVNNYEKRDVIVNKELKKKLNNILGIAQMEIEEGLKGDVYSNLVLIGRGIFYKYRKDFGNDKSYLDARKYFSKFIVDGELIKEDEEFKYIYTELGEVKMYKNNNFITYIDTKVKRLDEQKEIA